MKAKIWTKNPQRSKDARLLDQIEREDPYELGGDLFDRLQVCLKWRDRLFVQYFVDDELIHTEYERR